MTSSLACASAIMFPQVAAGGRMPRPRKLSDASATISTEITTTAMDSIGGITLGTSSRSMIRGLVAPIARAARTNSRWAYAMVFARASRTIVGMVSSDSAKAMLRTPGSSMLASTMSRISGGTASSALVSTPITESIPRR